MKAKKQLLSQEFIDHINKYATDEDDENIILVIELQRGEKGYQQQIKKIHSMSNVMKECMKFFGVDIIEKLLKE